MFLRAISTAITVYHRKPQIGINPEEIVRTVVSGAFWDYAKSVKPEKDGHTPSADTIIFIPYSAGARLEIAPADIIVKGVCDDVESISDIIGGAKVIEIKERCFGSRRMWHWEVHCK